MSVQETMEALFAPPGRNSNANVITESHPYYKRPGKGHNHDCCDACGEGGDIICCDSCPASFHLSCHAPPIEEEDIPTGEWVCLRCYVRQQGRLRTIEALDKSNVFGFLSNDKTDVNEEGKGVKQSYRQKYELYLGTRQSGNMFDHLVAAAKVLNAEEFALPASLKPTVTLPNTWKWSKAQDSQREYGDKHNKRCMACGKGVRGPNPRPFVACDFCPIVYHLDCLDPPLSERPRDTWMCPNHVEPLLDSRLLSSTRLTERLGVWDRFASAPVDCESVKLEFFRKARRGRIASSCRQRFPNERKVKVPSFVKSQYRYRQPKLTSSQTFKRRPLLSEKEEQTDFITGLVAMQTSLLNAKMDITTESKKANNESKIDDNNSGTDSDCSLDSYSDLCEATRNDLRTQIAKVRRSALDVRKLPSAFRDFLAQQKLTELWRIKEVSEEHEVRARAVLIPLNRSKLPFPIRYRTLEVGMGGAQGPQRLDISEIGWCNFVSQRHFVIYFDQLSRVYEIINYSEHGLIVDQNVYSLNRAMPSSRKGDCSSQRMSWNRSERACHCSKSIASMVDQGCENSAIITHGSYIRLGCIEFVFSLATAN